MTGWFSPHKDTPAPAPIEVLVGAADADLLVLHCPVCEAQHELAGDAFHLGRIQTLIGDHIRTHDPGPWGWR